MAKKLNKTQLRIMDQLTIGSDYETVTNPYTGVEVVLSPTQVAIYDFIKGCEMMGNLGNDFDQARYLFADLSSEAYMNLLD